MIKAILFDIGGCFLKGSIADFADKCYKILGMNGSLPADNGIVFDDGFNRGKISADECFRKYFSVDLSEDQLKRIKDVWTSTWTSTEEMTDLAGKLKKNGYTLAVLSNSDPLNSKVYAEKGWYSHFDHLILSHEIGVLKPEKRIYEIALEKLDIPADRCLFIDDQEKVLVPAREIGMKTIHYKSLAQLKRELEDYGVKI